MPCVWYISFRTSRTVSSDSLEEENEGIRGGHFPPCCQDIRDGYGVDTVQMQAVPGKNYSGLPLSLPTCYVCVTGKRISCLLS